MKRAVLVFLLMAACGDDSNHPGDTFEFDHSELTCPSDSLNIVDPNGHFAPGSTVTFQMGSTTFDGSAVVLADGSIDCGLPANAPAGDYEVIVKDGGTGDGVDAGTITLDSTTCS